MRPVVWLSASSQWRGMEIQHEIILNHHLTIYIKRCKREVIFTQAAFKETSICKDIYRYVGIHGMTPDALLYQYNIARANQLCLPELPD